jgi:glutamine phosphoribosylpyrophosphate amidotransferase
VQELIGHNHTVEQIRDHIGADSLGYLSIEGMMQVVREGVVDQDKGARPRILLFSSSPTGR